jgi:hypothetical protein
MTRARNRADLDASDRLVSLSDAWTDACAAGPRFEFVPPRLIASASPTPQALVDLVTST